MTSLRQSATAGYRWLTLLFFVGVVVQFFLAGLGVFDIEPGHVLDNQSSLDPHRTLGNVLVVLAIVLVVLVAVARPTRVVAVPYLALLVAAVLQSVFAGIGGQAGGGLHGLNACLVFGLAGYLAHRAFRREISAP
jgi:uncharacterized membrane protein